MASQTPIRTRGKRGAPKEVKWHSGKRRKVLQAGSATPSERASSTRSTPSAEGSLSHRHRRKQSPELSKLEQLPTEVLQTIFEFSVNLDLPLVSPRLASQLASKHLYHSLTSIVLDRDFEHGGWANENIQPAMRLMNSRFFSWSFFRSWLHEECERRNLQSEWEKAYGPDGDERRPREKEEWIWYKLHPSACLPPPVKLLRGPFTQDKTQFLNFLLCSLREDTQGLYPFYIERAREGLQQAVSAGCADALHCFWGLDLWPDTDLLRAAVMDSGCDKNVVCSLVNREMYHRKSGSTDTNLLDPALWSWAEKAQANGNNKGRWLKELLRDTNLKEVVRNALARNANGTILC